MSDWYEEQQRRAADAKAKRALEDAEYEREQAQRTAERAERAARDAEKTIRAMRFEYEELAEYFREEVEEWREKYRQLNALLVNLAVKAVPILRQFRLFVGTFPEDGPEGIRTETLCDCEALLNDLIPIADAELARMKRAADAAERVAKGDDDDC